VPNTSALIEFNFFRLIFTYYFLSNLLFLYICGLLPTFPMPLYETKCENDSFIFILTDRKNLIMDKLELTGQNRGRVFNYRSSQVYSTHSWLPLGKTAKLKVENSAQITVRFSRIGYSALRANDMNFLIISLRHSNI